MKHLLSHDYETIYEYEQALKTLDELHDKKVRALEERIDSYIKKSKRSDNSTDVA